MRDTAQAIAVLAEARRLILAGWCRNAFAEDIRGYACDVSSDEAVRFCAFGAIERACMNLQVDEEIIPDLKSAILAGAMARPSGMAVWNDSCADAAAIVEGFDRARLLLVRGRAAPGDQP